MLDFIGKVMTKIFGSKSARDVKTLWPLVLEANEMYEKLQNLSNDELRQKTTEFRERIATELKEFDDRINEINKKMEDDPDMSVDEKELLYKEIDDIEIKRNVELEKVLSDLLPEAFAVVKEAAHRFKENEEIPVTASERDKEQALKRDYLIIKGDQAIYQKTWTAAGTKTTWDMLHYDVQLVGGIVLHQGKIAEMATGEGKTLVSTLPAYLNALAGKGVHIVTVNDYLARRDCEWNGPLYEFLGITVDCIEYSKSGTPERRKAYEADITYGTNNEFGFDYLRDNMAINTKDIVQKGHHYAMVDEVDSVLVDDARTPLIISGPIPNKTDQQEFNEMKPRVEKLYNAQKTYVSKALQEAKKFLQENKDEDAGFWLLRCHRGLPKHKPLVKLLSETGMRSYMLKSENFYMQEQSKHMWKVDEELFFVIDEKNNVVELTDKGINLITDDGVDPDFFILPDIGESFAEIENSESLNEQEKITKKDGLMRDFAQKSERIHTVNQLLKAYVLFEKDTEYIIADGKIKIVDEQTGRVMDGRRYSDGLHQAIESKENVKIEAATQTHASITLQNYFRMYHKLSGMTGTAETEATEFWQIYKLDVVVIPTHRPMIRDDREDLIYKTRKEKFNASIEEIQSLIDAGRPVLVGTTSVEISEFISKMLKMRGIKHNLLNAKQHQREAEIVAEAGQPGNVTIATNMAGRGTDIKIGKEVKEAGGLAIIGTERHESRRVDRQLRGRAGRQGDPGSTQFFVSLEDNLMRIFGSERISKYMDRLGMKEGEVIQHSFITKSIERAQKKVEQNHFGQRKTLLEYDDVMNAQREVIYGRRKNALFGERLIVDLNNMLEDICNELIRQYQENNDYEHLRMELLRVFAIDIPFNEQEINEGKAEDTALELSDKLKEVYNRKTKSIAGKIFPVLKNVYETRGKVVEIISVPFTDGTRMVAVRSNLKMANDTEGMHVIRTFEKTATLALIDEAWKEHLRELDDLRSSVQTARYEQKDPLLIYKFESYKLFQQMLSSLNKEVLSMLFKSDVHVEKPEQLREASEVQRADNNKYQTGRPDEMGNLQRQQMQAQAHAQNAGQQAEKPQPIKVGPKVGRNDPCPCGSGKKYKQCHGKD